MTQVICARAYRHGDQRRTHLSRKRPPSSPSDASDLCSSLERRSGVTLAWYKRGVAENDEHPLVVAVAAVLFDGESMLCMRRSSQRDASPGIWETLSGRVRPDEDPLAAVHREIGEECGLEVELDPRPVTAYPSRRNGEPMVVIVYRGRLVAGQVTLSHEHDAFDWLTPGELAGRSPLAPLVRAAGLALEQPWPATNPTRSLPEGARP